MSRNKHRVDGESIKRELGRLKAIDAIRIFGFPAVVLTAGLKLASPEFGFLFPTTAVIVTAGVALAEAMTKWKRKELDQRIESAEKENVIAHETAEQLRSTLNEISVGGPSA